VVSDSPVCASGEIIKTCLGYFADQLHKRGSPAFIPAALMFALALLGVMRRS
jgi:hypothetical protein